MASKTTGDGVKVAAGVLTGLGGGRTGRDDPSVYTAEYNAGRYLFDLGRQPIQQIIETWPSLTLEQKLKYAFERLPGTEGPNADDDFGSAADYHARVSLQRQLGQELLNSTDPAIRNAAKEKLANTPPDPGSYGSGESAQADYAAAYQRWQPYNQSYRQQTGEFAPGWQDAAPKDPNAPPDPNDPTDPRNAQPSEADLAGLKKIEDAGGAYIDAGKAGAAALKKLADDAGVTVQELKDNLSGITNTLGSAAGTANSATDAALARMMADTDRLMSAREGAGWGADVESDAESLAAQRAALGNAEGIFGGSLDYTSQAAGAFADPNDVARQRAALDRLFQEAETGGADQKKVFDKFFDLSDPTVTAKERAAFEQIQGAAEGRDRSQRLAIDADLAQRGLRSGASQIASQLSDRTSTANARNAGLLGIQGMAVDRALSALGGAGTTANQMRTLNQSAGRDLYTGSADMRKQGFNEEYQRGTAADAASANNQQTRFGGAQLQGEMANAMRDDADIMSRFNKQGSQTALQHQDDIAVREATRIGNLAIDRTGQQLTGARDIFGRATSVADTGLRAAGIGLEGDQMVFGLRGDAIDGDVNAAKIGMDVTTGIEDRASGIRNKAIDRVDLTNEIDGDKKKNPYAE